MFWRSPKGSRQSRHNSALSDARLTRPFRLCDLAGNCGGQTGLAARRLSYAALTASRAIVRDYGGIVLAAADQSAAAGRLADPDRPAQRRDGLNRRARRFHKAARTVDPFGQQGFAEGDAVPGLESTSRRRLRLAIVPFGVNGRLAALVRARSEYAYCLQAQPPEAGRPNAGPPARSRQRSSDLELTVRSAMSLRYCFQAAEPKAARRARREHSERRSVP